MVHPHLFSTRLRQIFVKYSANESIQLINSIDDDCSSPLALAFFYLLMFFLLSINPLHIRTITHTTHTTYTRHTQSFWLSQLSTPDTDPKPISARNRSSNQYHHSKVSQINAFICLLLHWHFLNSMSYSTSNLRALPVVFIYELYKFNWRSPFGDNVDSKVVLVHHYIGRVGALRNIYWNAMHLYIL